MGDCLMDDAKFVYFPIFLIVLKGINDNNRMNTCKLSLKCKVSYTHIVKIVKYLVEHKLVVKEKVDDRSSANLLTEKGKKIVQLFDAIIKELEVNDIQNYRYNRCRK